MPSPQINQYRENLIANNHAITSGIPTNSPYDQLTASNFQSRAQARAMEVLNGYNPFGNGPCPNFNFIIPGGPNMGRVLNYINSNGEILLDGTGYSALSGENKKIVYFWIPNFIRYGMLIYDANYNI